MRRAEQVLTGGGAVNRAKFDEVSWSRSVSTVSIARSRDRSGSKITSTPASRRVGQGPVTGTDLPRYLTLCMACRGGHATRSAK